MSRLIALWDRNIKIGHGENVCEALARQSLQCYKSSGQWSDLAQLNRPAILTLNVDHGQVQYVLLRALSGEAAVIDSRGSALHMPLARLSPLWTGEFLLLWRREVDTNLIGPGIRGEAVVWLRKRLAEASGTPLPPPIPDRFGPELRASLVRFQTAHGLDADGVAGIRTLIALSDVKRSPDTPTLQGGT
jgi:general secretion pathway protein A